jgi:hypothetical protein
MDDVGIVVKKKKKKKKKKLHLVTGPLASLSIEC